MYFFLRNIVLCVAGALSAGAVIPCIVAEETTHHWQFKDGEGSIIIKDSAGNLPGKIITPEKASWAREDDRDWFLTMQNGTVEIPHDDELDFPDGFIVMVKFSCDLDMIGKNLFAGLIGKGRNYKDAYSILIQKRGKVLVYLNGMTPAYISTPGKPIASNRDNELILAVGGGRMLLFVNGAIAHDVALAGSLKNCRYPLRFGSFGGYDFTGNIYEVKLEKFDAGKVSKLQSQASIAGNTKEESTSSSPFPKLNLPDPPGTITLGDFSSGRPVPLISFAGRHRNHWSFRSRDFIKEGFGVLHPPEGITAQELILDPKLSGIYDCYAGIRAVGEDTALLIHFNEQWHELKLAGVGHDMPHFPLEQLIVRNIRMDGQRIRLAPAGSNFYLGYLKFIPKGTPRIPDYPAHPGFQVNPVIRRLTIDDLNTRNKAVINRQIETGYFRERHYVPTEPTPQPDNESLERGFLLWSPDWMELIFQNSTPARDPGIPVLRVALAAGESEPITLAIRALRQIAGMELRAQAPVLDTQGRINSSIRLEPALVMPWKKRTTNFRGASEFMQLPGYLAARSSVDLAAGETRQFFLTVTAPDETPGGIYHTECVLKSSSGQKTRIPLEIEVYDFILPKIAGCDLGFWCSGIVTSEKAVELVKNLSAFGMNSAIVSSSEVIRFTGDNATSLHIDFAASPLTAVAQAFIQFGLTGRIHLQTLHFWRIIEKLPQPDRQTTYIRLIRELDNYARNHHWPKVLYHSFDEVLSSPDRLADFTTEHQWLREAGVTAAADHIWYKTSRPYQKEVDKAAPYIDVFINRYNNRNLWYVDTFETMIEEARQRNVEVMAYNSHNAITATQPSAMRFLGGWFFQTIGLGATGQLFWTWNHVFGNPADDLDGTDTVYIMPEYGEQPGGPTLELLAFQEGADDLRYLQKLKKEIARAEKEGMDVSEAEQLLTELMKRFDWNLFRKESVFFNSRWDKTWEKEGKLYASGNYVLPVGWNLSDYHVARIKMAKAIRKLLLKN